jgi:predicted transcriptional regulator
LGVHFVGCIQTGVIYNGTPKGGLMAAEKTLSLMNETLRLLKERNQTLPEVASATDIPFYWLRKFHYGEVKNPSVNRIQKLYEFLSGRKLINE